MIKSLLLLTILVNFLYSDTNTIEDLQTQFKQDVIELNIFKKRYNLYLKKHCKDDIICYRKTINTLKSWDTVKKDKQLDYYLQSKTNQLQYDKKYWEALVQKINTKSLGLEDSQFVSIVDLDKQLYIITLWNQQSQKFYFIGQDYVSSGNMNREKEVQYGEDHYLKTPSGIFKTKSGWRSSGKVNLDDNTTLGYGQKNRYIFYFGEQQSIRYNTFDKNKNKILDPLKWKLITDKLNFAVHSHESSKPMGTANSHGCIRMTDEMNRFLDNNSILHKNVIKENKWIHKYSEEPKLSKYRNYAGEYLIVFDNIK